MTVSLFPVSKAHMSDEAGLYFPHREEEGGKRGRGRCGRSRGGVAEGEREVLLTIKKRLSVML